MPKLFLSYSHKDRDFVQNLVSDLKFLGVEIWVDFAELKIGDSIIQRISQGLDSVEFVGAVISTNSISSNWVQKELDVALNQEINGKKLKVFPILKDDVELPRFLSGKIFADFRNPTKYFLQIAKVVSDLGLDFDPLPPIYHNSYSNFRDVHEDLRASRAILYNQLALKIMEWAQEFSANHLITLYPQDLRRAEDRVTYAVDRGEYDFYIESEEELKSLKDSYSKIEYMLSQRGVMLREAFNLFQKASFLGDPEATWNLGWRYELGEGVAKNHQRALFLWSYAAKSGHQASIDKLKEENNK